MKQKKTEVLRKTLRVIKMILSQQASALMKQHKRLLLAPQIRSLAGGADSVSSNEVMHNCLLM